MKPPCMLITTHVLPAIRVIVAKDLVKVHELKPVRVASKMGLTPAAVTQYVSGVRGKKMVDALQRSEKTRAMLNRLTMELVKPESDIRAAMPMVCELCKIVREERMLCHVCDFFRESSRCDICSVFPGCSTER
jgi:predicted transcriptional regulator